MPVEEIRPGQKGECLTVFEGDVIEPFSFLVKGVMEDYLGPGRDLVMIRLLGKKPEFTGVVAGMSGSPCSIDGRLVGALGYSFASFAKEPIAGVTPIKDMIAITKLPKENRPWRLPSNSTSNTMWENFEAGKAVASADPAHDNSMRPIAVPLTLSGMSPDLLSILHPG